MPRATRHTRRCLAAGLVLAMAGQAHAAGPPFPLGVYAGNPDGYVPANEAAFEARLASFVAAMGTTPQTMNAYVDFSKPVNQWAANAAFTAWSWEKSPVVGHSIVPVIGVPMSDNAHWYGNGPGWSNDDFFRSIRAGTYDGAYRGIVDGWAAAGFGTMYLRLGYEMDGQFMPWFMGRDATTQADWVMAFRHLVKLMRVRAAQDGVKVLIAWNPADINWTALSVAPVYPGDHYVDVIATDAYSPLYPTTLYDWATGSWTFDSSLQQWWSHPLNMRHFWTYPSANPWHPLGTGGGWGFDDTIDFARYHHKPLAVSETGAGGDGVTTGPLDDPVFPDWLARELRRAQAHGVTVAYVDIWDVWVADGDWAFSEPGDGKPLEAAAWLQDFGVPPAPN